MSDPTRILISGAGVGGLALAQALRRGGAHVTVYEKDPTPRIRDQGYRIHIDDDGNAALRDCLPPEVMDNVRKGSGVNGDLVAFYSSRLEERRTHTFPGLDERHITHVDRNTFRADMLTEMEDIVHFGHQIAGYRVTESGRVAVDFGDGGGDEGDVLVGADGVNSAVRHALIPHATVRDLGVRCLYGRMTIDDTTASLVPGVFDRGFVWLSDDTGLGGGFASMRFRRPGRSSDYVMVTLVATPQRFGVTDERLSAMSSRELWAVATETTTDWHPTVRAMLSHAEPDAFLAIPLRAGQRVDPWASGPVTLLGDAIHTMPPTGGVGANTALRDAATLAGELLAVHHGEKSVTEAVAAYERVMLPRGFDTVDGSMRMARQLLNVE